MWKRLKNSKTAWTAVGGILVAIGSAIAGELPWKEAMEVVFVGLIGLFLKDGQAKK